MEKKQIKISVGLVMAGVLAVILPNFMDSNIIQTIGKPLGYVLIFFGVVYIVAGENLGKSITKIFNRKKYQQMKDMTPEQIMEQKKMEHEQKLQELKYKTEIEKQKAQIEKIKAQTNKLRNQGNSGTGKMPDVLGNISGFMGNSSNKKKKNDIDLKDLF